MPGFSRIVGCPKILLSVGLASSCLLHSVTATAQQLTWGGATNNLFSEKTNWVPSLSPISGGESIIFATSPRTQLVNDLTAMSLSTMTFEAGANSYTLSGQGFFLAPDSPLAVTLRNDSNTGQAINTDFIKLMVNPLPTITSIA